MMQKTTFYILFVGLLSVGCQPSHKSDFEKMEWLLGTWQGEAAGQQFYENWTKGSGEEFSNINFNICNGDTMVGSRAKIQLINNVIAYTSDNLVWELSTLTDSQCVFKNTERGETFTFSLNENDEWSAYLVYPSSQIEYTLTKTAPVDELLKNTQAPLEGHYEGYFEFNRKKLPSAIDFRITEGKQTAFLSSPGNLILNDPVSDVCYNPPYLTFKKNEGSQLVTFSATVKNDTIAGELSGELPAKFHFIKVNNYIPSYDSYTIENIELTSGKTTLPATIYLPKTRQPTAALLMISGSGAHTKEEFNGWANYFASQGIATLIYDKRDVSNRAYPNVSLTPNEGSDIVLMDDLIDDASSAFEYLKGRKEIDPEKIGIWGISQGGIVAPMFIASSPDVAFVIAVSAPTTMMKECYHFQKLIRLKQRESDINTIRKVEKLWAEFDNHIIRGIDLNALKPKLDNAYAEGWGHLTNIPQAMPTQDDLKYNFGYNTLGLEPALYWAKVNIPTYAVYGDNDTQVPATRSIEELTRAFQHNEDLLTIKSYPNADHLIKSVPNREDFDFPRFAPGYLTDMMQWLRGVTK